MAKQENFTAGRVAAYQCEGGKNQSIYWDGKTPGLGLRVTATGAKSYIFQSRLHGVSIRLTVGDVRTWTVAEAQAEATRLKTLTDQGVDPRQVKEEQRAKDEALKAERKRKAVTVGEAWTAYVEAKTKQGKWSDTHLRDHVVAVKPGGEPRGRGRRAGQGDVTYPGLIFPLLKLRLADLTAKRVQTWLEASNDRGKTEAAKCFRLLRAFLNWSGEQEQFQGIVSADAHSKKEVRALVQKVKAKQQSLQREQLPACFTAVRSIANPVISHYLQALLLTGARREELAAVRWEDVDFQWNSLTIFETRQNLKGARMAPGRFR